MGSRVFQQGAPGAGRQSLGPRAALGGAEASGQAHVMERGESRNYGKVPLRSPHGTPCLRPLDRIQVQGFKSIRDMDLELRRLNLLIGGNGSGKSNFISVFDLLNRIVEKQLQVTVQRWGGADAILHYGQKNTPQLLLKLWFDPNGYEATLVPSQGGSLFFSSETCLFRRPGYAKPFDQTIAAGNRESDLSDEHGNPRTKIAEYVLDSMRSWRVYHFHDTGTSAKVKQPCDIGDNLALRSDASNLAAFLFLLRSKHPGNFQQIVNAVRQAAPFFREFHLRPMPLNEQKIALEWFENGSDAYFNAHSLSDGTLRFICLATLLLQPSPPSTILIDEPELGLHPFAIELLASMLRSASQTTQVIASTQSVTLVNRFEPQDIIVVDRHEHQSTFKRLSEEDMTTWLDEYGLGDLWEKNVLGGRPH